MNWTDGAIILSTRRMGEQGAIIGLVSPLHGLYYGAVRGAAGKSARGLWQPGNIVIARWQARLSEHLGTLTGELAAPIAFHLMQDHLALSAFASAAALLQKILPERDAQPTIYTHLENWLTAVRMGEDWPELYVRLELAALAGAGFGLDFSRCAGGGDGGDLCYVSPKSGCAVSRNAGAPYHEKLLPLPRFLREEASKITPNPAEILDGLRLTGYFLDKWLLAPQGVDIPARRRFAEHLTQALQPVA